jgi:hypothetical protein
LEFAYFCACATAMINVNDGFGGGNNITGNSIYNTCRQSGDHGPINSWDRMPFLTKVRSALISALSLQH